MSDESEKLPGENLPIEIFSDGACSNGYDGKNSCVGHGPGGWGIIIKYQGKELEFIGGEPDTTNQRMEIAGLTQCIPYILSQGYKNIHIISDSQYVGHGINGMNKWLKKKDVKNWDLWKPIFQSIITYNAKVTFTWVKGHNGHPENERCNTLAENYVKTNYERIP